MKIRTETPAPRADSALDSQLTPEQAQAFADQLDRGLPLHEAADWLLDEHGIQLSRASISRWASRRRRARSQTTYAQLKTAPAGADLASVVDANALLLNQMILAAGRNEDPYTMMHASKVFANLLGTVARTRRADTSRLAAETTRRKFEYNAALAALEHAEELHKISSENQEDKELRVAKAIYRMFGKVTLSAYPQEYELYLYRVAEQMEAEEAEAARLASEGAEGEATQAAEISQPEAVEEPAAPGESEPATAPEPLVDPPLPEVGGVAEVKRAPSAFLEWDPARSCWIAAARPPRPAACAPAPKT